LHLFVFGFEEIERTLCLIFSIVE